MTILVTGVAGFIGFHLANQLLKKGNNVLGIDNLSKYYDVNLKKNRLKILDTFKKFNFNNIDISDYKKLENAGVDAIFGPGTNITDAARRIIGLIEQRPESEDIN